MLVSLLTRGSPDQLTGGYLYHKRLAALAPVHDARVEFVSVRTSSNPFRRATGDVVLVDSIAASAVAPWGRGTKPLAAIIHQPPGGIDRPAVWRRVQAASDRRLYRRCALLLVASDALADELALDPHSLPRERMRVAAPGSDVVDGARVGAVAREELRRGRQAALLSVGNWMARKGTLELLAAVASLAEDRVTLHLVGRDDVEPRYARRVHVRMSARDLRGRVVYHGALTAEEVAALYRGADAFALPSYREPYGTVYGEALVAGLPVVGWRAGNLPHLATDGVEGVILPPGDVTGLTSALDRLATDLEWRGRLAEAARRRGALLPTWSDTAALVFASLRELVG